MSDTINATAEETAQLPAEQSTTEQQEHGAQSGTGTQSERLFTQDEVNGIVRDRLQRDREKRKAEQTGQQAEQAAALEARTAELAARESRIACHEYLLENGLPVKLLDIIDTSDAKEFERKAAEAVDAIRTERPAAKRDTHLYRRSSERFSADAIGEAFRSDVKHTPKPTGLY